MFERYTEKARRCIFSARYEASRAGSPWIETGHLLLGMRRDSGGLVQRLNPNIDWQAAETILAPGRGEKVATSVDLPLSKESQRVLGYAAEESEQLNHRHIGSQHLLLGLLREANFDTAQFLKAHGIGREEVIADMGQSLDESMAPTPMPEEVRQRIEEMRAKGMASIRPGTVGGFGGGGLASKDEAGRTNGRVSSCRYEDDWRVQETHMFQAGHEVTVIERSRISDDGKTLIFSVEVSGPGGEVHQHTMNFPIG